MIFTVAEKAPADAALDTGLPYMLRGQGYYKEHRGLYRGGAVFLTREDADIFLAANAEALAGWAVFGCDADWERHCQQHEGETHRRLVIDRPMVKL